MSKPVLRRSGVPFRACVRVSLLGCLILSILTGCSSSTVSPEQEPPQELTAGSKPAVDTPEAELLREGQRYFDSGVYSVAKDVFERLRDGYPLGAYAEFASIKVADCEFESSSFSSAAALYEDFLKSRPASRSTPYVMLRAARSNQLSNQGVGRDDTSLKRARELYQELLEKYPTSPFAAGAKALLEQTEQTIAANEKLVIEFYRKQGKEPAYEARERTFKERFGTDVASVDVDAVPPPPRELVAQAPIGNRALVESNVDTPALSPSAETPSRAGTSAVGTLAPSSSIAQARASRRARALIPAIRLVECDRSHGFVFLHLSTDMPQPGSAERLGPLLVHNGKFSLQLPGITTPGGEPLERDCFGTGDVTIFPDGRVTIQSLKGKGTTAQVLELTSPTRILVAIDG